MQRCRMLSRRQVLKWAPVGADLLIISACGREGAGSSGPTTASAATSTATQPGGTTLSSATTASSPTTEPQRSHARAYADLADDLEDVRTPANVSFALALRDPVAGLDFSHHGDRVLETASIVKVDMLAALLLHAQDRGGALTSAQRSQADQMIRVSSNEAAWELWSAIGGSTGLDRANRRLGLAHTQTRSDTWGLTKTTPRDQVRLIDRIAEPAPGLLSAASSAYALGLMRTVAPEQAWGISAAARRDGGTALKNGWLPRSAEAGRWIANSIGRVSGKGVDLRIAILSHGHQEYEDGVEFVEKLARLAAGHLYP